MKRLITSYTFDASLQKITFDENFLLEQFLIITNVKDNIIIYNFADTNTGYNTYTINSPTGGKSVLVLDFNTTTMDDSDTLQIFIEDITNQTITANLSTSDHDVLDSIHDLSLIHI